MKRRHAVIVLVTLSTFLVGGWDQAQAHGSGKYSPPWMKKVYKPAPKPKPKPKPPQLRPTLYGGQATAVNLTNHQDGSVLILGDAGPLPRCGGSIDRTLGATNVDDFLSLDSAHVAVSGVGCVSTAEAQVQNFFLTCVSTNGVTNTLSFSNATAQARAECTTNGLVLSASSSVEGLQIDGTNVVVTGATNQVITLDGGSIVVNAQMSSQSTNSQKGEVTVAAVFLMLGDWVDGSIGYAKASVKCGSKVPSPTCDKVTGSGFIMSTNMTSTNMMSTNSVAATNKCPSKAAFVVLGGVRRGIHWGYLLYFDRGTGLCVRSTAVTNYTSLDSVTRQIDYEVLIDDVPGTARVIVTDNGEPGRNDQFDITLSTGYHAGGDLGGPGPGGGNIRLHKCPPGWFPKPPGKPGNGHKDDDDDDDGGGSRDRDDDD